MAIVQRSIQIKASPQETMAQLSDASRWPDWYPGMTELTIAAPFPEKEGKVAFKVRSAGMSIPVTESVIDFQPGKLQLFQHGGHVVGERSSLALGSRSRAGGVSREPLLCHGRAADP
jgi:hypothetical protein